MFKNLRILALLLLLLAILIYGWIPSSPKPDWEKPLQVTVFPFNADGSSEVEAFIEDFGPSDLAGLQSYFQNQARRHGAPVDLPFVFRLGPSIDEAPDAPEPGLSDWERLKWAIKLRWSHWQLRRRVSDTDIVLVARFHRPVRSPIDLHSIGMPEPRFALVNLIAGSSAQGLNSVKMAHELMHTVGASDLYDPFTKEPIWPSGYARNGNSSRFPQSAAELMAGRIPITDSRSRQAEALLSTTVGRLTASEIGWAD